MTIDLTVLDDCVENVFDWVIKNKKFLNNDKLEYDVYDIINRHLEDKIRNLVFGREVQE